SAPAIHVTSGTGKSALSATTVAVAADFSPRTSRFAPLLSSLRRSLPGIRRAISPGCERPPVLERTESFRKLGIFNIGEIPDRVKPQGHDVVFTASRMVATFLQIC